MTGDERGNEAREVKGVLRSPMVIALLITLGVTTVAISLFEFTGYYWVVSINWNFYISHDTRPFPALAFSILVASVVLLASGALLSRSGLLPHRQFKLVASAFSIVAVLSWYFLVLSYEENLFYQLWVIADILVFGVALAVMLNLLRHRLSRRIVLAVFSTALVLSLFLAVPGYSLANRTVVMGIPLTCNVSRCTFGISDPTLPAPSSEALVPGRVYDFYFDVIQGQVQEIMLTSAPGTGNMTYWSIGGVQGLSNWNGVGVDEFTWSPETPAFYQIVFLNQNYPSTSLIITRVTIG
jgi:hypothetical protein